MSLPKEKEDIYHDKDTGIYHNGQLKRKVSATYGAVLQYGPLVLVTDTFYQGGFTAEIYEFVEIPEEAGCGDSECRLNFCEKAEQIFKDGGRAIDWCLTRAKEHYLNN